MPYSIVTSIILVTKGRTKQAKKMHPSKLKMRLHSNATSITLKQYFFRHSAEFVAPIVNQHD